MNKIGNETLKLHGKQTVVTLLASPIALTMSKEFRRRSNGKVARKWQIDAAESLLLGLDTVVIAGTGAGKTTPYMLPLFLQETTEQLLVVVEPLINLQRDQVSNHYVIIESR